MDSLIVLRKPLRKTQLEPKFIIPKKSKKAVPKVDSIPPNPDLGEESNEPPISFVKLYQDLCVENSSHAASLTTRARMWLPARVDPAPLPECPPGHLHVKTPMSRSDTSLATHYFGTEAECTRVFTDLPPPSSARAELIFELDYDTCSKDSGFC